MNKFPSFDSYLQKLPLDIQKDLLEYTRGSIWSIKITNRSTKRVRIEKITITYTDISKEIFYIHERKWYYQIGNSPYSA